MATVYSETEKYANDLKKIVNWKRMYGLIKEMGNQFNKRKELMDKADVIEQGLQEYSNERLRWASRC